jgi:hypothetical protein
LVAGQEYASPMTNSLKKYNNTRLVIGTSRTVGSAKKLVRIASVWWRRVHEDAFFLLNKQKNILFASIL